MIHGTVLVFAVFLTLFMVSNVSIDVAYSKLPSPLEQFRAGVSISDIQCNNNKILLESSKDRPVCVMSSTAETLQNRGYILAQNSIQGISEPQHNNIQLDDVIHTIHNKSLTAPKIYSEFFAANNKFAVDFYNHIPDKSQNIFFSPTSIYLTLFMLYDGAEGNTAEQIEQVLRLDIDDTIRYDSIRHAISLLNESNPYVTLSRDSSVWLAEWFAFNDSYVNMTQNTYQTEIQSMSFTDSSNGIKKINNWISHNTNNKVSDTLKPNDVIDFPAMILANVLSFNGTWETTFPKENTTKHIFWLNDVSFTDADFMHVQGMFNYAIHDSATAISLPYRNSDLSMMIILPYSLNGISYLDESLVDEIRQNMIYQEVEVFLPKFMMETSYNLISVLQSLEINDVFNPNLADLTRVVNNDPQNLFVGKMLQKAIIDVNEGEKFTVPDSNIVPTNNTYVPTFLADRTFTFLIQDDSSGTILFMGKYSTPSI